MGAHSANNPEPVLDAGKVAAAVTGVLGAVATALVAFGVITPEQATDGTKAALAVVTAVVTLIGVVAPIWQSLRARRQVVPLQKVIAYKDRVDSVEALAGDASSRVTGTVLPTDGRLGDVVA
jgi:hypothetical protein